MASEPDNLDASLDIFEQQLNDVIAVLLAHYGRLRDDPVFPDADPARVDAWFDEALPEDGLPFADLLQSVSDTVVDPSVRNIAPRMFAYVMSGGNQASVIADLITSALDQNVAKWHLAPSMTAIEKTVIRWAAGFVGWPETAGGAIVSGGSAANLTALTVARNIALEHADVRRRGLAALPPMTVYASEETHNCVTKSVELLGIGSDFLRRVPTQPDFTIDTSALVAAIEADLDAGLHPLCVIGNAGTVNTGAIDPLDELATIADRFRLWFHVDGCYGGLAAALPDKAPLYSGLARADSLALDFHKWLYQPFEIGCTLVRDWRELRRTYHTHADYLDADRTAGERFNLTEHHFDLSRSARAFKVWFSLKAYGAARMRAMITKDIALTAYLEQLLDDHACFEPAASGPLAIICFRYRPDAGLSDAEIDELNRALVPALEADRRIFITGTVINGRPVLRACLINHRMTHADVDFLVATIAEVAAALPRP